MQIRILALMLFSFSLFAEDLPPDNAAFINSIECVLNKMEQDECGEFYEKSCSEDSWETEVFEPVPFETCVKDICKDKSSNLGLSMKKILDSTDSLANDIKKDMGADIEKLYGVFQATGVQAKKELEDIGALHDLAKNYQWLIINLDNFRFNYQTITGRLDFPATWEEMKAEADYTFPDMDKNRLKEFYSLGKGIDEQFKRSKDYINFNKSMSTADSRRLLVGKLEERVRGIPDTYPQKLSLLQKVLSLQSTGSFDTANFSTSQYSELLAFTQNIFEAEMMTKDPYSQVLASKYQKEINESFDGYKMYSELLNGEDKEIFKSACENAIANQASHLVSKSEKEKIVKKINEVNQSIISRLNGMFSKATAKSIERLMKEKVASLPPSREEYLQRMGAFIKEQQSVLKVVGKDMAASLPPISGLNGIQLAEKTCTFPLDLGGTATQISAHDQDDFNHSIALGATTLHDFENNGLWIYAHEMGHMVSNIIREAGSQESAEAFIISRECLSHQKAYTNGGERNEEDFADMFTFYFLPEVKNGPCAFFNEGLGFNGEENHLHDGDDSPKHSSSVYRLFHAHKYTGEELPKSCQEELKSVAPKPQFRGCWYLPKE